MEISGSIKTYDWGKIGSKSMVAQLALKNDENFVKDFNESTPYAEVWMGDHVSGPSIVKETGEPLSKVIASDTSSIGGATSLPFLFKVLSIAKPLSIQVHPNKQQAERLHANRPDLYKDPNHKPEIAIALTDFLALCGFRPPAELYSLLKQYQPLSDLLGSNCIEELQENPNSDSIKAVYTKLMRSPDAAIEKCIVELAHIFSEKKEDQLLTHVFDHCNHHFPKDIGILSIFFLNIVQMRPGQAIFLAANEPHAYLSGDCIECMACSDNVIRAGLTPKFKDVETLLEMLDFTGQTANEKFFQSLVIGPYSELFKPPVNDFAVIQIKVPASIHSYCIENRAYGSIILVLKGNASAAFKGQSLFELKVGSIVFVPACIKSVGLTLKHGSDDGFVAYQALYNDF